VRDVTGNGDVAVTFATADVRSVDADRVLRRYFDELAARFPEGFDVARAYDEVAALLTPPNGELTLAREAGRVVACGGLHFLDASTAEVRRMWVDPAARGRGVGRALLAHLEGRALLAGCDVVVLDTHAALSEAVRLYVAAGYEAIAPYNDNPSAHFWFRKRLGAPDADAPHDGRAASG